jgi:predicted dehydrogenase
MNILHVGLGMRGRHWLEMVRDRPDMTSAGCVDADPAALDWARTHFPGMACFAELGAALQQTTADAAIIASPPALHASQATAVLEANLAAMIEQPLATGLVAGAQVFEVAHRTGRPMIIAQHDRALRGEQMLQHLVRAGHVGRVTHVSCIDRRACPATGDFVAQVEYAQVLDTGVHHFDSLRRILGVRPLCVWARCGKAPWSMYVHGSTTEACVAMENDIHVQYHGTLTSSRDEHTLWIEGTKGVLRADRTRVWWRKRGWRFFLPLRLRKTPPGDALQSQRQGTATSLDQLKAVVSGGQVPETNNEDNLWTLSMLEAVILSDQTRQAVSIAELFSAMGLPQVTTMYQGREAGE